MPKRIKIIERKLGQENCYAQMDDKKRIIEIDEREKGMARLKWLLHEALHIVHSEKVNE